jgi:hypothetical protein
VAIVLRTFGPGTNTLSMRKPRAGSRLIKDILLIITS